MREVHKCHNLCRWYMKPCHCPRHLRFCLEMRRLVQKSLRSTLASKVQLFLTVCIFFFILGSIYWILSLQPFEDILLICPLPLSAPSTHAFIHLCQVLLETNILWRTYILGNMGKQESHTISIPLTSFLNEYTCLWFPLKLKPQETLDFRHQSILCTSWMTKRSSMESPFIDKSILSRLILQI